MIEDIAEKIVEQQVKRPYMFIGIFIILALIIAPGIFNLVNNVEPSLEKVLPSDIQEVKTMNNMRTQFGADMMYLIVYPENPITDIREPEFIKYQELLVQKIKTREYIDDVNSMSGIIKSKNNEVIPNSLNEIKSLIKNDPFIYQYTNQDYSFSVIRIRSDTGSNAKIIKQVVNDIKYDIESIEELNPGARIEITGFNAIDKATFEVIMADFAKITAISMLLVGIVVFITFKSFAKGMLPMIVVMNALLWTMGIVGYLNLTITVVTMVAAAMIMGLGIDFGIHVVHSYFQKKKKKGDKKALTEVVRELLRAMVGASLTTIAGFLALLFGVLPAMKTLGIILAIGILNTLIGAVFLLPVVTYIYDRSNLSGKFKGL
jgi:uncharacterized protein